MNNEMQMQKIETVLATGQLQDLTPKERVEYLNRICNLVGLNPLTKPFEFIKFQNKMVIYATRGCADQLRKINGVSIKITERSVENGLISVSVEATDKHGRVDSDIGVVVVSPNAKGDMLANALMKAITKAKRRVTLSICGLGFLDESEFDTMEVSEKEPEISTSTPTLEAPKQESGEYIIKGGKYEGKTLSDVSDYEVKTYIESISTMLEQKGQASPDWFEELKEQLKSEAAAS